MSFYRPLHSDNDKEEKRPLCDPMILDYLEVHREAIIKELRQIDEILIKNGRLHTATLNKRIR